VSAAGRWLIGGSALAAVALVGLYLAAGGSSYEPTASADPCAPREWREPEGIEESAQQFALSALDGAACELGVTREELAVALPTEETREEFAAERGIDDATLEAAVRAGVLRGIDDAVDAGALNPLLASGMREIAERLPVDETIALIIDGRELFENAEDVVGGVLDDLEGLIPDL
jgi:hypothetical protein